MRYLVFLLMAASVTASHAQEVSIATLKGKGKWKVEYRKNKVDDGMTLYDINRFWMPPWMFPRPVPAYQYLDEVGSIEGLKFRKKDLVSDALYRFDKRLHQIPVEATFEIVEIANRGGNQYTITLGRPNDLLAPCMSWPRFLLGGISKSAVKKVTKDWTLNVSGRLGLSIEATDRIGSFRIDRLPFKYSGTYSKCRLYVRIEDHDFYLSEPDGSRQIRLKPLKRFGKILFID